MANRELGEVSLTVGEGTSSEQTYTFRLNFNKMAELEDFVSQQVGREVFYPEIAQKASRGSLRHIRWLVLAMLQEHHPDITEQEVGALLLQAGIEEVKKAAAEAMSPDARDVADVQPETANGANPQTAQDDGTGDTSNDSPVAPV